MPITQVIRAVQALMKELAQKKITAFEAKKRSQQIQADDQETSEKLAQWKEALDNYCAESSQKNFAATANVVRTFPGFR